jgi:cytidylate kinase
LQRGADVDAAAARSSITDRDAIDTTRTASPLAQAADAFVIDATHLDIDAVVAQILALVESARAAT